MATAQFRAAVVAIAAACVPASALADLTAGAVYGRASVWVKAVGGWRRLASGARVDEAAPVRVGPGSSAEVLFDRSRLVFGPGTRAEFVPSRGGPAGVSLACGSVRVELADGDGPFLVRTALGVARIGSGEASVTCSGDEVGLSLVRGTAAVVEPAARPGTSEVLAPGRAVRMTKHALRNVDAGARVEPAAVPCEASVGKLRLRDTNGNETEPLETRELRVRVRAAGAVALTEIEQTFFNSTPRVAEGVFYFPVPPGAALCRFAMYVDDTLVEGELVERVRAREVYESIVRRRRDPALMEWQEGNVFKTRIFPIPANGPKRILVGYTQLLPSSGGERTYTYGLVSKTTQATSIGRFELDAEFSSVDPKAIPTVRGFPEARIRHGDDTARVTIAREDFHPDRDVVIRCASAPRPPLSLVADRRAGEDGFFMLSYLPPDAERTGGRGSEGRDVVLMVDTSLSRGTAEYRAGLDAARTFLNELSADDRCAVIAFDVEARLSAGGFRPAGPDAAQAIAELQGVVPLGATDLEKAFDALEGLLASAGTHGTPEVVMIGDGIATLGETATEKLAAKATALLNSRGVRFHALALGGESDTLLLAELARATNGICREILPGDDVCGETFRFALDVESAVLPPPEIAFAGAGVHGVYPARLGPLVPGDEVIVVGRYRSAAALEVTVRSENREVASASFGLPETESTNVFIPRLWARKRMGELLLAPQTAEVVSAVSELSQEFTLMSPYTSFLVLESEAEYARFGITRAKRRRYWEEMGRLRSAPPPDTARARPPDANAVERPIGGPPAPAVVPPPPVAPRGPFTFGEFDLRLLSPASEGSRIVSTALAMLCLETYYRYVPLSGWPAPSAPHAAAPRASGPATRGAVSAASDGTSIASPVRASPPVVDAPAERLQAGAPVRTSSAPPVGPRTQTATVDESDTLSDIPLGGTGILGTLGVGGGGAGTFGFRTGGGRRRAAMRGGGTALSENTVDTGHGYLARVQRGDGSWGDGTYEETALATLAFLGAGHTERTGRYKDTVGRAIAWLASRQGDLGQLGNGTYDHAVCTLVLAEAFGMGRVPATGVAAQRAVDRLLELQEPYSGWGEGYLDAPRPLPTYWAVLALKSALVAGLRVDARTFQGAIAYLDRITGETGAVGPDVPHATGDIDLLNTAGAMVCRQFMGWKRTDPLLVKQADLLVRMATSTSDIEADGMYLRYFGTMAMFQMGGPWWKTWNAWMRDPLVARVCTVDAQDVPWCPEGVWIRGSTPNARDSLPAEEALGVLRTAIARAGASPESRDAFESLAAALAATSDVGVLSRAFVRATESPRDVQAMVLARIALVDMHARAYDDAAAVLGAACTLTGRAENLVRIHTYALTRAGKARTAVDLLLADVAAGRAGAWHLDRLARLLADPGTAVTDPVRLLAERLPDDTGRHAALKQMVGSEAMRHGRLDVAAALFEQAYRESGRREELAYDYYSTLAQRGDDAALLPALTFEARSEDRVDEWRMQLLAAALQRDATWRACADRFADTQFADRPRARAALKTALIPAARDSGNADLLLRLYDDAYTAGNQPLDLLEPYVACLLGARMHRTAVTRLEEAVRCGYHTRWAFDSLASCYLAMGMADQAARACSSQVELYPRDAHSHLALASHYQRIGRDADAARQHTEAAQILPEDAAIQRQAIDAAIRADCPRLAQDVILNALARLHDPETVWGKDLRGLVDLLNRHRALREGPTGERIVRLVAARETVTLFVTASWNRTTVDVDLHVVEPGGADCHVRNARTAIGGTLVDAGRSGLGPEEYSLKGAKPGTYRIDAAYRTGSGQVIVVVDVVRQRANGPRYAVRYELTLSAPGDRRTAGTVTVEAEAED